jgi:uncharacterized membrane protein YGL010W
MSTALRAHFADYAAFHRTKGNQACHYLGIPMIVLSIIALLAQVPLGTVAGFQLTLAEPMIALTTLYYLSLDAPLAVMMLAASALMAALGRGIPLWGAVGLFVVGWIIQFIGHYAYEGKSPAFYRNAVHLLVGPLWILAKATRRA